MTTQYTNAGWPANEITAITKALTTAMDEVLVAELKTADMTPDPAIVQATQEAGTVKIATMTTTGATDYSKTNGWGAGSASLEWESYTLGYDRGNSFLIDSLEKTQTGSLASAANAAGEFLRQHMVPEIDATRIARLSTQAVTDGHSEDVALTKANILTKIEEGIEAIFDNTGYDTGCTVYASTSIRKLLKGSSEYTKVRNIESGMDGISSLTETINGNKIVWVPSRRMYSAVTLGTGFAPSAGAKEVNFAIAAPGAAQGIVAYSNITMLPAGTHSRGDGDFYGYRMFHDLIMPKQKRVGLFVSLKTPSKYTLTYDKNDAGASGTMAAEQITPGATVTVKTSAFTPPSGKAFAYWSVAADGSAEDYHAGDTLTMSDNITLYAQYVSV